MVCEDCGNIIGDQVIPGLIHAVPAEQMQVHPAASKLIDFPIFVAGTEIVVDGDKIVEVTSPRGRKVIQLQPVSEEGMEEQDHRQVIPSSSYSQAVGSSSQSSLCDGVEEEGERVPDSGYHEPYSAVEMVEDNDPYNRVEVDVIMLEDAQFNVGLNGPLNVGQPGGFGSNDLNYEAGEELEKLTGPSEVSMIMSEDMTGQSCNENDPKVGRTLFDESMIKMTNSNSWEVDEIITEAEAPQKVTGVILGKEDVAIDNHLVPDSDSGHVHKNDPVQAAEVSKANVTATDPLTVVETSESVGPSPAPEDSQASVVDPEDRLEILQLEAAPLIKVKPAQELMMVSHSCFRCGSEDSTGPWHKHKKREKSFLCHLCFSYYR